MRIRTRSLVIMLGQGLSQATAFLLGIVLVRLVTKETVGTYQQVYVAYGLVAGLLMVQLESSLYYFIPKLGPAMQRSMLVQTLAGSLVVAGVIAGIMFFGASEIADMLNNKDLAPLIRVFALYPFGDRLMSIVPAFFISVDRAVRSTMYNLALSVLRAALVIAVFAGGGSMVDVVWAVVLLTLCMGMVGCLDVVRLSSGESWRINFGLVAQQAHYVWPLWATYVAGAISIQFDKLLISHFFDAATYAVYAYGAIDLPVVSLITSSIATAMMPSLVVLADKGKKLDALAIWQEGARKASLVLYPCFGFFIFVAGDLMTLLYRHDYADAAWPFRVRLLLLPQTIVIFGTMFRALGQTKPYALSILALLITNIALGTALTMTGGHTLLGFVGPTLGAFGGAMVAFLCCLLSLRRVLGVPVKTMLKWKDLGVLLCMSVICGLAAWAVPLHWLPLPAALAVRAAVFAVMIVVVMWRSGYLTADEKDMIRMPWRMLRGRFGR